MSVYKTRRGGGGNADIINGRTVRLKTSGAAIMPDTFVEFLPAEVTGMNFEAQKPPVIIDDASTARGMAITRLTDATALVAYVTDTGEARVCACSISERGDLSTGAMATVSLPAQAFDAEAHRLTDTTALVYFCTRSDAPHAGYCVICRVAENGIEQGAPVAAGRAVPLTENMIYTQTVTEAQTYAVNGLTLTAAGTGSISKPPPSEAQQSWGVKSVTLCRLSNTRVLIDETLSRWSNGKYYHSLSFADVDATGNVSHSDRWTALVPIPTPGTSAEASPWWDSAMSRVNDSTALFAWLYGGAGTVYAGAAYVSGGEVLFANTAASDFATNAKTRTLSACMLYLDKLALIAADTPAGYRACVADISGAAVNLRASVRISQITTAESAETALTSNDYAVAVLPSSAGYCTAIVIPTAQLPPLIKAAETKINGLTKETCTAQTTGAVWVPDV